MMKYVFFKNLNGVQNISLIFNEKVQHLSFKRQVASRSLSPSAGFAIFDNNGMTLFGRSVSIGVDTLEEVNNMITSDSKFFYLKFTTDYYKVPEYVLVKETTDFNTIRRTLEEAFNQKAIDEGLLEPKKINSNNFVLVDKQKPELYFEVDYGSFISIDKL